MTKKTKQVRGPNRRYTLEFRQEALRLVTERKLSVAEAARQLGIGYGVLLNWKKRVEAGNSLASGSSESSAVEMELSRLRAENSLLRMERDILKKATVFFAKESR